jgi:transcriptional regulator with XRE-family HTH domain
MTLSERVKARIVELYRQRKFTQATLAKALSVDPSAAHGYVSGDTRISLDVLEAVCEVSGVPVAELVAPVGSQIKQLNGDEAAVIRALRQWPLSVTRSLGAFLAFFADEPFEDAQARSHHELWRGLNMRERDWLHGIAVMLREQTLGPDLREALVDRLSREAVGAGEPPKVGRIEETPKRRRTP